MTVRARLFLLISLALLSVLLIGAELIYAWSQVNAALRRSGQFEHLQAVVQELEQNLHEFERSRSQHHMLAWARLQQRLADRIAQAPAHTPAHAVLLDSIQRNSRSLEMAYQRLGGLYRASPVAADTPDLERHLVSTLMVQMEMIREDSRYLVALARDNIEQIIVRQVTVALLTLALLALLLCYTTLRVARSISRSLYALQAGFSALARADFRPVSGFDEGDEFAEIAREYNATLRRLEALTVSRDKLQVMVDERTAEIRKLAERDSLTMVYNRRALNDHFGNLFASARRHEHQLSVLMVDLDYFKQINDKYGHAVGDDALVHFCDIARRLIRDEDLLARYGGEEFVIVLNFTGRDGACEMAQRLLDALARQPLALDKQPPLYYTASIGIATLSPRHANCEALLKSADEAVYRAKSLGRNRFEQVD